MFELYNSACITQIESPETYPYILFSLLNAHSSQLNDIGAVAFVGDRFDPHDIATCLFDALTAHTKSKVATAESSSFYTNSDALLMSGVFRRSQGLLSHVSFLVGGFVETSGQWCPDIQG
jgi:hypothetical protein